MQPAEHERLNQRCSGEGALTLDASGFMRRLVGDIRQDTAERISDLSEIRHLLLAFRLGCHGNTYQVSHHGSGSAFA
jgi:hypothetical protein